MTHELPALRHRLTFWYAGIFGLILLSFGIGLYVVLEQALLSELQQTNQRVAASLGARLKVGSHARDLHYLLQELQEIVDAHALYLVQVYDTNHNLIASWPQSQQSLWQPGTNKGRSHLNGHLISWSSQTQVAGNTFVVGQNLDDMNHILQRLVWVLSLGLPCALLGTLLAGSLLAEKALRPIRSTLEEQRHFMADASHELRTPVTILLTQTELALNGISPERPVLETVRRTAWRMQRLIADLLTLSRADTQSLGQQRLRFEINEWVEDMVSQWAPIAQSLGLELTFQEALAEAEVEGDPDQLSQLLGRVVSLSEQNNC